MPSDGDARPRPAAVSLPVISHPREAQGLQRSDSLRGSAPEFVAFREKMQSQRGPRFWRSLEELAGTPEFEAYLHREFPEHASEWRGESRREFLKLMGASLALAGLSGCELRPPRETIVPLVNATPQMTPGMPLYFCTAQEIGGWGTGLVVQSRMGRPVKLEGNPRHPASRGGTGIFAQAATLDLYDPDRASTITRGAATTTMADLRRHLAAIRVRLDATAGEGLRILSTCTRSPTFGRLAAALQSRWPAARWHVYDSVSPATEMAGNRLAWGEAAAPIATSYRFERAAVVLSLGGDFLAARDAPAAWIKDFADARRIARGHAPTTGRPLPNSPGPAVAPMLRLYSIGATPTLTDAKADHHLLLTPQQMVAAAGWLAAKLQAVPGLEPSLPAAAWTDPQRQWLETCADDLQRHRFESSPKQSKKCSLVIAGREQPPVVHALVHAINDALGATGQTVRYIDAVSAVGGEDPEDPAVGTVAELTAAIRSGRVRNLIILDGNPVFDAPADLAFAEALERVAERLHLSAFRNETSALCQWHVPQSHFLESWGDTRAPDGTAAIIQPLIEPLYDSLTSIELIGQLIAADAEPATDGYRLVRQTWRDWRDRRLDNPDEVGDPGKGDDPERSFDAVWQEWLRAGVIEGTTRGERVPTIREDFAEVVVAALREPAAASASRPPQAPPEPAQESRFSVLFRPDPTIWDGRFANNGWLQELPKPMSKLTWDNVVWISVDDAERLELRSGDLVQLDDGERQLVIPVWIMPRQASGVLTLFFGYGRRRVGRVGARTGVDVYPLRTSRTMWLAENVRLRKTGQQYPLASTQQHFLMNERHQVQVGTWDELEKNLEEPGFAHSNAGDVAASLYPPWSETSPRWGMTIDLAACTGCTACVIACQAENNIPVVGKQQVAMSREMHWMRVDMYHSGSAADPDGIYHQPVPCMHCELAPCEVVCPVAATTHSQHGLNQMIYNRCVGTRYCSNNCPYKVRRFNFFNYGPDFVDSPSMRLLPNPEVTVRSRGVMEKCTYCVQRIQAAEIAATLEERPLRDGDVRTACQQVCPAEAIQFGDLSDPTSQVHHRHQHPLNYALLEELNTRPRTTYLAEVKNPAAPLHAGTSKQTNDAEKSKIVQHHPATSSETDDRSLS